MKNAIINARIESELKMNVESILKNLGLTATQAINVEDFSFDELERK